MLLTLVFSVQQHRHYICTSVEEVISALFDKLPSYWRVRRIRYKMTILSSTVDTIIAITIMVVAYAVLVHSFCIHVLMKNCVKKMTLCTLAFLHHFLITYSLCNQRCGISPVFSKAHVCVCVYLQHVMAAAREAKMLWPDRCNQ